MVIEWLKAEAFGQISIFQLYFFRYASTLGTDFDGGAMCFDTLANEEMRSIMH